MTTAMPMSTSAIPIPTMIQVQGRVPAGDEEPDPAKLTGTVTLDPASVTVPFEGVAVYP